MLAIWAVGLALLSFSFWRNGVTFEVKIEERGLCGLFFVGFELFTGIRPVFSVLIPVKTVLISIKNRPVFPLSKAQSRPFEAYCRHFPKPQRRLRAKKRKFVSPNGPFLSL